MKTFSDFVSKKYLTGFGMNILTNPVIYDTDVTNASIRNIVTTYFNARPFNITYGSGTTAILFENVSDSRSRSDMMDKVISAIELYEQRVIIDKVNSRMDFDLANHVANIYVFYSIKNTVLSGTFKIGVQL